MTAIGNPEVQKLCDMVPNCLPKRYLRNPKVVLVRELSEDTYLISDLEDKNEYVISNEVLKREYEEI